VKREEHMGSYGVRGEEGRGDGRGLVGGGEGRERGIGQGKETGCLQIEVGDE